MLLRALIGRSNPRANEATCGLDFGVTHVYTLVYILAGNSAMATARVFRSGNSQAVRLPKEFRLKSKEVEIFRRGEEIVLREKQKGLARAFEILANLPDDVLPKRRQDSPPQKRDAL
jgi:antitoxin VapB